MNIMRKIFLTFLLVAFASAAFAEGTPKKPSGRIRVERILG